MYEKPNWVTGPIGARQESSGDAEGIPGKTVDPHTEKKNCGAVLSNAFEEPH
jgi:hypothetical protein